MHAPQEFVDIQKKLGDIVARAVSEDRASRLVATAEFKELLSQIQNIVGRMVPIVGRHDHHGQKIHMVTFPGKNDHHKLQLDAARVLAKLVSETSGHKPPPNPSFVRRLKYYWTDVTEQAVRALGAIGFDFPECRNYVLDSGALEPLLDILRDHRNSEPSMLMAATCTLSIFCHGRPIPDRQLAIIKGLLPHLRDRLAQGRDESVIKVACQTIAGISYGGAAQIQAVIEANIIPRLVYHLQHGTWGIKEEAAKAVAKSTIDASPPQIQYLVNQGCLQLLCFFRSCNHRSIANACRIGLTNIINTGEAIKWRGVNNGVNPYQRMLDVARYTNRKAYLADRPQLCA